jgi:cytochrome P450 family 313
MFVLQLLIYGVIILLFVGYILFLYSQRHIYKHTNRMPGTKGLPIFGHLLKFVFAPFSEYLSIVVKVNNRNEGVWKANFGSKIAIFINSPEYLHTVLNSPHCLKKPMYLYSAFDFVSQGMVLAHGDQWRHHRKVLGSSFNLPVLRQLLPIFDEKSKISAKVLEQKVGKGEFNIYDHTSACSLESLLRGLMNYDIDCQSDPHNDLILSKMES